MRRSTPRFAACLSALLIGASLTARPARAAWVPWDFSSGAPTVPLPALRPLNEVTSALGVVATAAIQAYQAVLSKPYNQAFNPRGCPFSPSCSEFGRQSFERYGAARGLLMTCDRLLRCHPLSHEHYEATEIHGKVLLADDAIWFGRDPPGPSLPRGRSRDAGYSN